MKILLIYLIIINIIGYFMMFLDKQKAKAKKWRISEKMLFLIAFLGASYGTTLGMHQFRHKTKHWYFRYGLPALLILHIAFLFYMALRL